MANIIIGVLILLALCIIVSAGWKYIPAWVWFVFLCLPGIIFFFSATSHAIINPMVANSMVAGLLCIVGLVMLLAGIILTDCAMDNKKEREDRERLDRENAMLLNAILKEKGASFLNTVLAKDTEEQQEEPKEEPQEETQEETQETTDATENDDIQTPMDEFAEKAESCFSREKFNEKLNEYGITKENIVFYVKAFAYLGLFIAFCYCMASLFV